MSPVMWNNSFTIGVKAIDEHYQHVVRLLNKSYDAIQVNDKTLIKSILNELIDISQYHFNAQMYLMHKYDFNSIITHEEEHKNFYQQIYEFISKLNAGEALYNIPVVVFLNDWHKNHILVSDKELTVYLVNKGVSEPQAQLTAFPTRLEENSGDNYFAFNFGHEVN